MRVGWVVVEVESGVGWRCEVKGSGGGMRVTLLLPLFFFFCFHMVEGFFTISGSMHSVGLAFGWRFIFLYFQVAGW